MTFYSFTDILILLLIANIRKIITAFLTYNNFYSHLERKLQSSNQSSGSIKLIQS